MILRSPNDMVVVVVVRLMSIDIDLIKDLLKNCGENEQHFVAVECVAALNIEAGDV